MLFRSVLCLNEIGCYAISMLANTEKAKQFRKALANLIMELRKGNVGLVSAEEMNRLKYRMNLMSEDLKVYRKKYWKLRKVECVRTSKYMNQTFEKVIDNLRIRGLSFDVIAMVTELPHETLKEYLEIAEACHIAEFECQGIYYTTLHQSLFEASKVVENELKVTI